MEEERKIFGQIVSVKIQKTKGEWGNSGPLGRFRVLLFKICSFWGAFLVDFEI